MMFFIEIFNEHKKKISKIAKRLYNYVTSQIKLLKGKYENNKKVKLMNFVLRASLGSSCSPS